MNSENYFINSGAKLLYSLLACYSIILPAKATNHNSMATHAHHQNHAEPTANNQPTINAGISSPDPLTVNQPQEVIIVLTDDDNNLIDVSELQVVHTQPVHLLIIDEQLNDYHHKHPQQTSSGHFTFSFTPQTACNYRAWVDIKPNNATQQYLLLEMPGSKDCSRTEVKQRNEQLATTVAGYDFALSLNHPLRVGSDSIATVMITKNDKPVTTLQPVMGAFAHMVGFYDDYETIAHVHPMGSEPTEETQRGGPQLQFHLQPSHAGVLTLFLQVQIDNEELYAPFYLLIKE